MSRGRKPVSAHSCKCGQTDPQEFYKTRKAKCKKCVVEYTKNRLRKNPELNSAKIKYNLLYQQKNPFAYRMRSAQRRANAVGMAFDIDEEFLRELFDKQGGKCYYSGIPFQLPSQRNILEPARAAIVDVEATVASPKAKPRTMIGRLLGRS